MPWTNIKLPSSWQTIVMTNAQHVRSINSLTCLRERIEIDKRWTCDRFFYESTIHGNEDTNKYINVISGVVWLWARVAERSRLYWPPVTQSSAPYKRAINMRQLRRPIKRPNRLIMLRFEHVCPNNNKKWADTQLHTDLMIHVFNANACVFLWLLLLRLVTYATVPPPPVERAVPMRGSRSSISGATTKKAFVHK